MEIDFRSWRALGIPLGLLSALLLLLTVSDTARQRLADENGLVESVSALAYLAAMVIAGLGAFRWSGHPRLYAFLWALLCLLFFGEETSWLQHQIGYATPEQVAQVNAQEEFNLHNLALFQGGALTGAEALGWRALLKSQNLFQIGFLAYFLALPVLAKFEPARGALARLRLPYPGMRFVTSMWLPIIATIALTFISIGGTKSAIAEFREMLYALTILAFLALLVREASRR